MAALPTATKVNLNLYKGDGMQGMKEASTIIAKRKLVAVRVIEAVGIAAVVGCLLLMGLGWTGHIGGPIGITDVMLALLQISLPGGDASVGHGVGLSAIPLVHHAAALSWLVVAAIVASAFKALARFYAE